MQTLSLEKAKFRRLLGTNILLAFILGIALVFMLRVTENAYVREAHNRKEAAKKDLAEIIDNDTKGNLVAALGTPGQHPAISEVLNEPGNPFIGAWHKNRIMDASSSEYDFDAGVTYYLIVLLMLIAGSMGGVMCNLRGFFMHFQGEDKFFPANLEVPYYVRLLMGGGAGIFIYFVANFLITSLTTEYLATNVPFQGMVSFVALAMLAGFGSLEFFQRLKETALTLFGQRSEKTKWERIEELYTLHKKGVIEKEEFSHLKSALLNDSSFLESKSLAGLTNSSK
jgi:hypothetical protein